MHARLRGSLWRQHSLHSLQRGQQRLCQPLQVPGEMQCHISPRSRRPHQQDVRLYRVRCSQLRALSHRSMSLSILSIPQTHQRQIGRLRLMVTGSPLLLRGTLRRTSGPLAGISQRSDQRHQLIVVQEREFGHHRQIVEGERKLPSPIVVQWIRGMLPLLLPAPLVAGPPRS